MNAAAQAGFDFEDATGPGERDEWHTAPPRRTTEVRVSEIAGAARRAAVFLFTSLGALLVVLGVLWWATST